MRNLKLALNVRGEGGASDFQVYLRRERESYLKSLSDVPQVPISLQTSAVQESRVRRDGSALSASGSSLHFMSKNLSASPADYHK
jgi:hypothetical protein